MSNEGQIRKLEGIARHIRLIGARAEDFSVLGPRIARIVAHNNSLQFATRGAHYGTPWKPLKPATIADKIARGYPVEPLVRSGEMKRQFTKVPMGVQHFTRRSIVVGGRGMKPRWQQYGTHRNGKRAIPPRVIQRVSRHMNEDILQVVSSYLMNGKTR